MAHAHQSHDHGTVVQEREGPATALVLLAVVALLGFLIWLFAFSGVVFDRDDNDAPVINNQNEAPAVPGGGTESETETHDGGGGTMESPAP